MNHVLAYIVNHQYVVKDLLQPLNGKKLGKLKTLQALIGMNCGDGGPLRHLHTAFRV